MGKTTMDGSEQILFEDTEAGEYNGYVFLDTLQGGDTVDIRVYIADAEDDKYKLRDVKEFSGVQSLQSIGFLPTIGDCGYKVTARQTTGTYRTLSWAFFRR
jgi:hypothetical protein